MLSMNLNIAGLPKTNECIADFFFLVKSQLLIWLAANRIGIDSANETVLRHAAGDFFIVPINHSKIGTQQLKIITEQFENQHELGRFIDVDITNHEGKPVSSGKSKLCFYCKAFPAIECRRLKRHSIAELQRFQQKEIKNYLENRKLNELSRKLSILAIRAILYEISLSPKPGLVSALNSGVHTDMNYRTFIDSTAIISSYFQELVQKGFRCETENLPNALALIRQTGLQMETEMFAQTNGVNTQKGLIFLIGISLFSCGYIFNKNEKFSELVFIETVKQICANLQSELSNQPAESKSHSVQCFSQFKVGGIRFEAENGFPTVFNCALPILAQVNLLDDKTLTLTLLAIMSELDDTNILYRSDMETLQLLKQKCKFALHNFSEENYSEIINFCNAKRISPGGAADLLSISIFIYLLKTEFNYDF
ncbi:MAG TPA: hypothetical protein DCQ31_15135 [Bacteroidales bacterium]|nr:hypothetical protein [Bacteroidales bacterium]